MTMDDGRYEGHDDRYSLVLRIDVGVAGVISGDIYLGAAYLASVRTAPGVRVTAAAGRWAAVGQDELGATATGELAVAGVADATVSIRLDQPLNGLPVDGEITIAVHRVAAELRELGVEVETEVGVQPPGPVLFQGYRGGCANPLRPLDSRCPTPVCRRRFRDRPSPGTTRRSSRYSMI